MPYGVGAIARAVVVAKGPPSTMKGWTREDFLRRRQEVPWYSADPGEISPDTIEVFEKYSHIPPEEIVPHVKAIRDRAWDVHPYPCIGKFRFLNLLAYKLPEYPDVLRRVKDGAQFLDLGACLGQVLRKLILDGAPPENLVASDLHGEFLDLGYDLFRDRGRIASKFVPADIFDKKGALAAYAGAFDVVHASSFFHLFALEPGRRACKRTAELLKRQKGSLVFGRQLANVTAQVGHPSVGRGEFYRHNVESWKKLWAEVGKALKMDFDVQAQLHELPMHYAEMGWGETDGVRILTFAVTVV